MALGSDRGEDFAGESVREALELCGVVQRCRRECPTGVDMARMKIEFTAEYKRRHGFTAIVGIGHLPRYARWMAPLGFARMSPGAGALLESFTGFDRRRPLPQLKSD